MNKINDNELVLVIGGTSTSSFTTIINAFVRGINGIFTLGQSLGTSFKMWRSGKTC